MTPNSLYNQPAAHSSWNPRALYSFPYDTNNLGRFLLLTLLSRLGETISNTTASARNCSAHHSAPKVPMAEPPQPLWHSYLFPLHISLDLGLCDSGLAEGGAGLLGLLNQSLQLLCCAEQGIDHLLQVKPAPLLRHLQPVHHRRRHGFGGRRGGHCQGRQRGQHWT